MVLDRAFHNPRGVVGVRQKVVIQKALSRCESAAQQGRRDRALSLSVLTRG